MKAALRPTGGRLGQRNRSTPIFTVRRVLSKVHADISSGAKLDPRKAQTVELRLFAGLSVEETAVVLKVSPQTVLRDWKLSKTWLAREMGRAAAV